jgi:hypothetical protein
VGWNRFLRHGRHHAMLGLTKVKRSSGANTCCRLIQAARREKCYAILRGSFDPEAGVGHQDSGQVDNLTRVAVLEHSFEVRIFTAFAGPFLAFSCSLHATPLLCCCFSLRKHVLFGVYPCILLAREQHSRWWRTAIRSRLMTCPTRLERDAPVKPRTFPDRQSSPRLPLVKLSVRMPHLS